MVLKSGQNLWCTTSIESILKEKSNNAAPIPKTTKTTTTTPNNTRKKCADYGNRAESDVDIEDKFVLLEKAHAKKENLLLLCIL